MFSLSSFRYFGIYWLFCVCAFVFVCLFVRIIKLNLNYTVYMFIKHSVVWFSLEAILIRIAVCHHFGAVRKNATRINQHMFKWDAPVISLSFGIQIEARATEAITQTTSIFSFFNARDGETKSSARTHSLNFMTT